MREVGLNREFLHRSCVQLSPSLSDEAALEAEKQHSLRFVRVHAAEHASEIARSLIWRVVDTPDGKDRTGAWSLLNAVLVECGDANNDLSRTALAEKILLFLPYLVAYRWYSSVVPAIDEEEEEGTARHLMGPDKVIAASVINGGDHRVVDAQRKQAVLVFYRSIIATWKQVWRSDVYQSLKENVRNVERYGNTLSEKAKAYLSIPATFKDSLWRLRRKSPRPSVALHVLYCYGWPPKTEAANSNNAVRPRALILPTSNSQIESLDPTMHPRVKMWLHKLTEEKGGCRLCDTWRHTEARCPCELPFVKIPTDESDGRRRAGITNVPTLTYMEAVDKLYRYNIKLPLRTEVVLDCITQLIEEEMPYEELLDAFDVVRGTVTGPRERHALWLHASYALRPSKTLFDKPSDDAISPALEKAERHFKANRRFREWDQVLQSIEILDGPFRRHELPAAAQYNIDEVRETTSFFFCLIDGSLPASFTPGRYARVPEEVLAIASLKDTLCHVCLDPFHSVSACPKGTELWDLQVARLVLEDNDLLSMRYPEETHKLVEALLRIDMDDRQAKDFRKAELALAVKLVHERQQPVCIICGVIGHSTKRCEKNARQVLMHEHFREVDVRLSGQAVRRRIADLQRDGKESESRALRDAFDLLAGGNKAYPTSYSTTIRELDDAGIPLAAARYSTDAVQGFLLFIHSSDLLQHLQPLRDEAFPEVCVFCDAYHHSSEVCDRVRDGEQGFLQELRKAGLTLWQYLRTPDYYDERLPTDFMKGKESVLGLVRQFAEDYGPGGIARERFMEQNGLENTAVASQGPGLSVASNVLHRYSGGGGMSYTQKGGSGAASSYGQSFSQLVLPELSNGSRDANGAAAADVVRANSLDQQGNRPTTMDLDHSLSELPDSISFQQPAAEKRERDGEGTDASEQPLRKEWRPDIVHERHVNVGAHVLQS